MNNELNKIILNLIALLYKNNSLKNNFIKYFSCKPNHKQIRIVYQL